MEIIGSVQRNRVYYAHAPIGRGIINWAAVGGVCPSVHLSVPCLHLTQEWKAQNCQNGRPSHEYSVNLFRDQKVKGQGHQADECSHSKYPISSEPEGLRTSNLVYRQSISNNNAVTSKVPGQGRKVTWCVWQVLADKLRTKRPRNTKIGRKVVHPVSWNFTLFYFEN